MRRNFFVMVYITVLFASVGFSIASADKLHTQIQKETTMEFPAPFILPPEFSFEFDYLIKTEAHISILGADGKGVQAIDLSTDGLSIGEHKTFKLKKGEYTVKEDFTVTAAPNSPFFQGQLLESNTSFDWKFTASDDGTYDFSITADASLDFNVTGDLILQSIGKMGASIPVKLATTRFIQAKEKIKYTVTYTVDLSKTSSIELISKAEEPVVTFVVTGAVRNEDGTAVSNVPVTVTNETRNLTETATTDEGGIYKALFVGAQDSILAQAGDVLKVSVGDIELSYTLAEKDISKTTAAVNVLIEKLKITSVAISPKTKFGVGEKITVTATGSKGAKLASFSIEGIAENISMLEISAGTYVGKYIVKAGDNAQNAVITVTLTDAKGNVVTDSSQKVTVDTQIAITSVEVNLTVVKNGDTLTITVITEPKSTVTADFSSLDSARTKPVNLSSVSSGKYVADVKISNDNIRENSVKEIAITATDALKNTATQTLKVELKNLTPTPVLESVLEPIKLISGEQAFVWVKIAGTVVSATVTATSPQGSASTFNLSDPDGDGIFEGEIIGLVEKGKYSLSFRAINADRLASNTIETHITTTPWDINQDGKVDILDLVLVGKNYGTQDINYGEDAWTADINSDNMIDISDLVLVGKHFGEEYPPASKSPTKLFAEYDGQGKWSLVNDMLKLTFDVPLLGFAAEIEGAKIKGWDFSDNLTNPLDDWKAGRMEGKEGRGGNEFPLLKNQHRKRRREFRENRGFEERDGLLWFSLGEGEFGTRVACLSIGEEINEVRIPVEGSAHVWWFLGVDSMGRQINIAFKKINPVRKTTLLQNYPNPFNPETWIPYKLARPAPVTVWIYNQNGQVVRTLSLGTKNAGVYLNKDKAAYWNGRDSLGQPVASGMYFYTLQVGEVIPRIEAGELLATRKMVIMK